MHILVEKDAYPFLRRGLRGWTGRAHRGRGSGARHESGRRLPCPRRAGAQRLHMDARIAPARPAVLAETSMQATKADIEALERGSMRSSMQHATSCAARSGAGGRARADARSGGGGDGPGWENRQQQRHSRQRASYRQRRQATQARALIPFFRRGLRGWSGRAYRCGRPSTCRRRSRSRSRRRGGGPLDRSHAAPERASIRELKAAARGRRVS